ncbi:hypothetical protein J2S10_003609 [Neobacillus ginsengisoli]|uniref:Uncharacterized protein n=1 Tax=Neobacillus ginsengisoli TaxID=904295 RepID=A0ABT9XXX0_9BACI|nr:hypothetical protein [Neobacillus ginsengisoli]
MFNYKPGVSLETQMYLLNDDSFKKPFGRLFLLEKFFYYIKGTIIVLKVNKHTAELYIVEGEGINL